MLTRKNDLYIKIKEDLINLRYLIIYSLFYLLSILLKKFISLEETCENYVNKIEKKNRIILKYFIVTFLFAALNAFATIFWEFYILRHPYAKIFNFSFDIKIMGELFNFPIIHKQLFLTLIILSIQGIITKAGLNSFFKYKAEYKQELVIEKKIPEIQIKNEQQIRKDFIAALTITGATLLIRNFLQDFRRVFQIIANNAQSLPILQSLTVLVSLVIIQLVIKITKDYEMKKCKQLLRKEVNDSSKLQKKITIGLIDFCKKYLYASYEVKKIISDNSLDLTIKNQLLLEKYNSRKNRLSYILEYHIDTIMKLSLSIILGIYASRIAIRYNFLTNLHWQINVAGHLITILSNRGCLFNNILFEMLFSFLINALIHIKEYNVEINNGNEKKLYYFGNDIELRTDHFVRTIIIAVFNAAYFSICLTASIEIYSSMKQLSIDNYVAIFTCFTLLTMCAFGFIFSQSAISTVVEIHDLKEHKKQVDLSEGRL